MRFLTAFLFALLCVFPALADKGGHPHNKDRDANSSERPASVTLAFGPRDRDVIYAYYGNSSNLPPGLAKKNGNLPPGLRKQLERNGRLPAGLEKRISPFPADIERRLPPVSGGCVRGMIGSQAVIYDPKTRLILDVLDIVLNSRH